MRLSQYFLPILRETPAEAQIASHRLMLRAGMIRQASAGIYSWLPLGYKVLRRIETIVHEEQQRAGHIPLLMPTLQSADLWRESDPLDHRPLHRLCPAPRRRRSHWRLPPDHRRPRQRLRRTRRLPFPHRRPPRPHAADSTRPGKAHRHPRRHSVP
jgi:hypothetical protein